MSFPDSARSKGKGSTMRAFRIASAALTLVLPAAACSDTVGARTSSESSGATSPALSARDFDPNGFHRSTTIDNVWFPMQPGTRYTWEGHAIDGGERVDRRVVFTVTDMSKTIAGVRTLVALDIDYNDDVLEEQELAFFAQDDEGNVWQIGQYPEVYEGGKIVGSPAWIHGYQGARAGLSMKSEPQPEAPSYAQGWGPKVGWNDRAIVDAIGTQTCTPVDCYDDVLVMREFSRTEPDAAQLKYYAAGVGNVRVGWRGSQEDEREVMVLVSVDHLTADELGELRQTVLDQEARAYRLSKDVYAQTDPMEPLSVT
jgi:hypothetical protein